MIELTVQFINLRQQDGVVWIRDCYYIEKVMAIAYALLGKNIFKVDPHILPLCKQVPKKVWFHCETRSNLKGPLLHLTVLKHGIWT